MRPFFVLLAAICWAAPVSAHDSWLQPQRFWTNVRTSAPIAILVGHGVDRAPWGVKADRVVMLRDIGPTGVVDHLATLQGRAVAEIPAISFATTGAHIVALQSNHAVSNLPAARFNAYLKEEGLTPALALRNRMGRASTAGREIYSRRAKALVQVGPLAGPQPHVTRPIGLTLEIVPERNPYALRPGERLPVRVIFEGRPLAGALVKLTNLDADQKPLATAITDRSGRTAFAVPRAGSWLLNVVWTKPIEGDPRADFDTTFSSLTFGYPAKAAAKSSRR